MITSSARTALMVIAVLGAVGFVGNMSGGAPGDSDSTTSAAAVDELRDCGTMRYGEVRADCVRSLQELLRVRGAPIDITGNYLNETTKHLKEFQATRGLRQDGVLDARTLHALVDLPGDGAVWDLRRECVSLSQGGDGGPGSQGRCVMVLRSRLAAHGVGVAPGDQFDTGTEAAVRAFQEAAGLPAIGVAGPQTKQALYVRRPDRGRATDPSCTPGHCVVYLSRGVTRDLADAFPDSELARWALAHGIGAVVCRRLRAIRGLDVVCQPAGTYIVDKVVDALTRAGRRNACLRVDVGYPPGRATWFPLDLAPDTGPNCRD
jgi:peptidoglycan hydrolase-like protein with peptidoglycan-binding domain